MPRIRAATIAEHKRQTREDILEAASVMFRTHGYADTSLGDIAGYAGIGRTTLYDYFVDKEDLLATIVERTLPGVVDAMLTDLPEGLGHRDRLGELIVRGLEFVSSDQDLGNTLMRALPRLGPAAARRVRAAHERLEVEITRLCRSGIAAGEFRSFDPEQAGRIVFALMMSVAQTLLHDAEAKQHVHDVADTLVRFVFDGLAAGDG